MKAILILIAVVYAGIIAWDLAYAKVGGSIIAECAHNVAYKARSLATKAAAWLRGEKGGEI